MPWPFFCSGVTVSLLLYSKLESLLVAASTGDFKPASGACGIVFCLHARDILIYGGRPVLSTGFVIEPLMAGDMNLRLNDKA